MSQIKTRIRKQERMPNNILTPTMRHPVFAGSGAIDFENALNINSPDFRLVLDFAAVTTPTVSHKVETTEAPDFKKIVQSRNQITNILYPQPKVQHTVQEITEIALAIKAIPKPDAMRVNKDRVFILNISPDTDPAALKVTSIDRYLYHAIEISIPNNPPQPVNFSYTDLDKYIKEVKANTPVKHIWLKIPTDYAVYYPYLTLTEPTAIVLGHGELSKHPSHLTEPDTYLYSGPFRKPHTFAVWDYIREQHPNLPVIISGGINHSTEIKFLLNTGALGVQLTSNILTNWMSILPIMRQLNRNKN